jgi:hypothetical protein
MSLICKSLTKTQNRHYLINDKNDDNSYALKLWVGQ